MNEAESRSLFPQETSGSATTGGMTKAGHRILHARWTYTENQAMIL